VAAEGRPSGGTVMLLRLRMTPPRADAVPAGAAPADAIAVNGTPGPAATDTARPEEGVAAAAPAPQAADVEFPRSEPVGADSVSSAGPKPAAGGTEVDGLRLPRPRPASDPPGHD
jgi:hypothetical protein